MSTKAKPRKAFGTLRDFGNHCFGGGGGNRTPVREHSTRSIYRFRSSMYFTALIAPDQAQRSNPASKLLAKNPGESRFSPV